MINIPLTSLIYVLLLLLIPLGLCFFYELKLTKNILISASRMLLQLTFIGVFLKYLFTLNNSYVNILWLTVMVLSAVFTTIKSASIRIKALLLPTFISFFTVIFLIVLYLNKIVISLDSIFSARYLIVIGGMLLGNSLRSNILGITTFYSSILKEEKKYLYLLSLGATPKEARLPFLRKSLSLALKPSIATMGTLGLVSIPGMMTGVILGGTSPLVALKYQIMIMLAILTSTSSTLTLSLFLTSKSCFDSTGMLKKDIFS